MFWKEKIDSAGHILLHHAEFIWKMIQKIKWKHIIKNYHIESIEEAFQIEQYVNIVDAIEALDINRYYYEFVAFKIK